MCSFLKKISFTVLIIFCTAFAVYPQSLEQLQNGVAALSEDLAKSLPFNASIGLNWSDAYIGKLIPSAPPHFGIGISAGLTTMKMSGLDKVASLLGFTMPDIPLVKNKMVLPAYAAEARIGGFFLPFDIGVKFGILPPIPLPGSLKMNYTLFGADFRWALMEGNVVLPKISIGLGVNYLKGGIGMKVGSGSQFTFNYNSTPYTLAISQPEVNLLWDTFAVEAKVQFSKSFLIITPYAGFGAGYSWSKAGYEIKTAATLNTNPIGQAQKDIIQNYLNGAGLAGIDFTGNGFSSIVKMSGFNVRFFGGLSLNLAVVRLDFTFMYNILDKQIGATFGFRVQL
ncbi:MAG: hypothetical protein LBI14_04660 [Treponema sp.]|jgi:hypothetical protein|nr:hypothetical protein [Treponema sp.]